MRSLETSMRFGKNVLSQYLRTNCDLALYLTLFTPGELDEVGLPGALDARPGVGSLRDAGVEQEIQVYNRLLEAFQLRCIGEPPSPEAERWRDRALSDLLNQVNDSPVVLVQPKFTFTRAQLNATLLRLGVGDQAVALIPDFEGFIPDIVLVRTPDAMSNLIDGHGDRVPASGEEARLALSVIDVKHAREANPSYESEAVLYAVLLANWLVENGYDDRFFVSSDVYLWTRGGVSRGAFQKALENHVTDPDALVAAMRAELDQISLPMYVQAIRRFFGEKMPKVIRTGEGNWRELDWHVAPTCASCDWLGYQGWLSPRDRQRVSASPEHYCFSRASQADHVSRLPLITRGSSRVLQNAEVTTVAQIAVMTGDEAVYSQHTGLKSERRSIPGYAAAIASGTTNVDSDRADGLLARYADLNIFLSVNFDPGAGLVTGIGFWAFFTQPYPFGKQPADRGSRSWRERWIVAAKSAGSERGAVLGFLRELASVFAYVTDTDPERGGPHAGDARTQIVLWDQRQFQELCLAVGRHLSAVLYDREEQLLRALAWIFPPEELQEDDRTVHEQQPAFAFVRDTVRRLVRVPALHALTLFNVAENYYYDNAPSRPDQFYREPLSDRIPRERIYELWSLSAGGAEGVVRWGTVLRTYNQLMERFSRTIDQQGAALASITWRLRRDFGARLRAKAPKLKLVVPNWASGVAHDAKLWIAWARFDAAVGRVGKHLLYTRDAEEVEATNEGIRLMRKIRARLNGTVEYEVSADSMNSKLRAPNNYLCLSVDAIPGFLALPTRAVVPLDQLPEDLRRMANVPMHRVFGAKLEGLDRTRRTAVVRLAGFFGGTADDMERLRRIIRCQLAAEFGGSLSLVPSPGTDVTIRRLTRILSEVGRPRIATPARETLEALGHGNRRIVAGRDPVTPIARVLWEGRELAEERARGAEATEEVVARVLERGGLNSSQVNAVRAGASRRLTIVWGPPGTGKTKTCAALLHGIVACEVGREIRRPYRVLITGPTYRAVGELIQRFILSIRGDRRAGCRIYPVYSPSRPDRFPIPGGLPEHVEVVEAVSDRQDSGFGRMHQDLGSAREVVVVAAVTHQCARIAEQLAQLEGVDRSLLRLFDFVLMDEASQVDMTTGVMPLALMRTACQLVVVGDHLQMPPVVAAEPPVGAEHLVGSLQVYLSRRFDIKPVPLLMNYRSSGDIVAYTRRLGYPSNLESASPDTAISLLRDPVELRGELEAVGLPWSNAWEEVCRPERSIVGITYPDGTAGQANRFEATCVAALAWLLYRCSSQTLAGRPDRPGEVDGWDEESFWSLGLGIVTPHRAQRAQVVRALVKAFPETDTELIDDAVDTVERFQGSERHTIIISFGVGDPDVIRGEERFLLQLERSNVAISRAMGKCIVFLSDEVASHIPDDRRAAATGHALRGIVDEWCTQGSMEHITTEEGSRSLTVRWR